MANIILESPRGYQSVFVEDELLRTNREIFLVDGVNAQSCNEIIKQLLYLDRVSPNEEITLYINSPGGSVNDGLAVFDTIQMIDAPVRGVVTGVAASMGAIIFLACDKREMLTNSKCLLHDPSFGGDHCVGGKKPHEIQAELDDLNRCRETLANIISDRTGKKLEDIYELTKTDRYLSASECIDFGVATKIITKNNKKGV